MAFVGYKTTADAVKALEYFHNTFIDTSRVQVEYARAVKSAQLPRPWSKHSEGSSAHRRTHETPEERAAREAKAADAERFIGVRELKKMKRAKKDAFEKEIDDAIAADPKLTEFMRLMAPRSQQRMWDNQAADVEAERAAGGELGAGPTDYGGKGSADAVASDEDEAPPEFDDDDTAGGDSDDDEYQEIGDSDDDEEGRRAAGKRRTETNEKTKKTKTKTKRRKTGREMSDDSESDESDSDERVDDDADDDELDDLDYLRRKSAKNFSDSEDDEDGKDGEDGEDGGTRTASSTVTWRASTTWRTIPAPRRRRTRTRTRTRSARMRSARKGLRRLTRPPPTRNPRRPTSRRRTTSRRSRRSPRRTWRRSPRPAACSSATSRSPPPRRKSPRISPLRQPRRGVHPRR